MPALADNFIILFVNIHCEVHKVASVYIVLCMGMDYYSNMS